MSISLEILTSQSANPPLLQNLSTHFLIKLDRIHIPIKHNPLHPPVPHLSRQRRHGRQQHFPKPFPPVALPHEQVLDIKSGFGQERRVVREEQHEPGYDGAVFVRLEEIGFWVGNREVEGEGFGDGWEGERGSGGERRLGEGSGGGFEEEDGE